MSKILCNIILGKEYDTLEDYNTQQILDNSNTLSVSDFSHRAMKLIEERCTNLRFGLTRSTSAGGWFFWIEKERFIAGTMHECINKAAESLLVGDNSEEHY